MPGEPGCSIIPSGCEPSCGAGPNQAHFCQPAGDRGAGEDCIDDASAAASLNFVATCAEGLRCVDAICRESCVNAGDCDAPETCILSAPTNSGDELSTGFCTQACVPFKDGACPQNMTCRPISADVGECVPSGAGPAFSRCTPGRGECAAGTHCVSYPNSGEARCHPNTADPSDASTHVLLAENLQFGEATGPDSHLLALPAELLAGPLQIWVFSAGTDRQDPEAARLAARDFAVHEDSALILRGDLAEYRPDGAPMISLVPLGIPAPTRGVGITYTCAALPDRAFGFCRQICDSKDYGQSVCAGEQMGCAPVQIQGRDAWMNLCAPVGQSGPGEACEPGRDEGQCADRRGSAPHAALRPARAFLRRRLHLHL